MSQHRSLKARGGIRGQFRSVLKRLERVKLLEKEGKLTEQLSCFGMPKVKITRIKTAKKAADDKKKEAAAPTEGQPAAKVEEKVEKKPEKKEKSGDKK